MSTFGRDLAQSLVTKSALDPAAQTATPTGPVLDMIDGTGRVQAVQHVGAISGASPTLNGKFQQGAKADGSDMADITGATFTQVSTGSNIQRITFDRDKRYIRYVGTIALNGGTSIAFGAMAMQQTEYGGT